LILKIFNSNQPTTVILLAILTALLLGFSFWEPLQTIDAQLTALPFVSKLEGLNNALGVLLRMLACFGLALQVQRLFTARDFYPKLNYLPATFALLAIVALFPASGTLHVILSAILLVLSLNKMLSVFREQHVLNKYFDAGLLLGAGSLFYPPVFLLLPIFIMALLFTRAFNWRELLLCIFGTIIAPIFWLSSAYIFDFWPAVEQVFSAYFQGKTDLRARPIDTYTFIALVVLIQFSLSGYFRANKSANNRVKNQKLEFIIHALGLLAVVLITYFRGYQEAMLLLAIPAGVFLPFFFLEFRRKILSQVVFALVFLAFLIRLVWGFSV